MMKKILAILLTCLMLASSLVGCSNDKIDKESSDTQTEAPAPKLVLVAEGASEYVILRSSKATSAEVQAIASLRGAIEEKYGVKLSIKNEYDAEDIQKAICIGEVPRQSVEELMADVGYNEYKIGVSGSDVVIYGGRYEKTIEAIERFTQEFLTDDDNILALEQDTCIMEEYANEMTVLVGGVDLAEYVIVLPTEAVDGLKLDAEALRQYCIDEFGFNIEIKNDTKTAKDKEIIIGTSAKRQMSDDVKSALAECGENKGLIYFEKDTIWLTGNSTAAIREAVYTFKSEYLNRSLSSGDTLSLSTENKNMELVGDEYTVMSFNILCEAFAEFGTPEERTDEVIAQIRKADPDMLGVQECTEYWYDTLCEALGDEYGVVGEINDTSWQRWRNAIFYRKDKFELIETKTQWLSNTPSTESKLSVSGQKRILTYATLKDKTTGKTFIHANTHMGFGESERPLQYNVLIKLLSKLKYPTVLTGDFNMTQGLRYFGQLNSAGYMGAHQMTANNDNIPTCENGMIDFCFVTPEGINVLSHEVLEEKVNGVAPSDHNAVVVKFLVR